MRRELLDCPTTFPKVFGIMGWHISLYHSHMIYTQPIDPPEPDGKGFKERGGWHQDSGRLNNDLEGSPRPRVSMKVGYFLTDATSDGTGFQVIPGSECCPPLPYLCVAVGLSVCRSVSLSVRPSVRPSACLSFGLSSLSGTVLTTSYTPQATSTTCWSRMVAAPSPTQPSTLVNPPILLPY
jgi:hypothetical protein